VDEVTRKVIATIAMIVAIIVVTVGGAGVAFAYWSAGGSGSGVGAGATTTPLTITSVAPSGTLYPGGESDVAVIVSNPNSARVHISSLALDTSQGTAGFGVDSAHSGCTLSTLAFTTQTNGGAGWTVAGKVGSTNGALTITLPSALAMSATAVNACQGATFTIHLVAA
jgi:hypothetical protein